MPGLGKLHVHKDPTLMMTKVGYDVMLNYGVSDHMVLSAAFPQDVLAHIAKDMAKAIEKDIFEQLLTSSLAPESLQGISTYGQAQKHKYEQMANQASPWNDWSTETSMADIKKYASVLQPGPSTLHGKDFITGQQDHGVLQTLVKAIPALKTARSKCPANKRCAEEVYQDELVTTIVQHLNDQHKWTREKIADWLDTLDFDLSFQEPQMQGYEPKSVIKDEIQEYDSHAMKFALSQPLLKPEDAVKLINPT